MLLIKLTESTWMTIIKGTYNECLLRSASVVDKDWVIVHVRTRS